MQSDTREEKAARREGRGERGEPVGEEEGEPFSSPLFLSFNLAPVYV
jgi:hypothetical protein